MASQRRRNASFIVRIWWERRAGPRSVWRGQVIHAQTGQLASFRDLCALKTFIEDHTGAALTSLDDEGDGQRF